MQKVRLKRGAADKAMARTNLSQNGVARRLEVSTGYLSQLLAGRRNPSPRVRQRILDTFKMKFDELFEFVEE
jgi:transcriptional regulator with XRE-family HTH domain